MKKLLWLDDERDPSQDRWTVFFPIKNAEVTWVKSYKDFIAWILLNGLPDAVCFDHDLVDISYNPEKGQSIFVYHEKTGYDCAKWLGEYCIENNKKLPLYAIQSQNPVGKENIDKYLKNIIKHLEGEQ